MCGRDHSKGKQTPMWEVTREGRLKYWASLVHDWTPEALVLRESSGDTVESSLV